MPDPIQQLKDGLVMIAAGAVLIIAALFGLMVLAILIGVLF